MIAERENMYIVAYAIFVEITIYPWLWLMINVLNILVICKRTFPKEKKYIIDMLCYLTYVKKFENTFCNIVRAKLKT